MSKKDIRNEKRRIMKFRECSAPPVDDIEADDDILLLQQGRLIGNDKCSAVMDQFGCASLRDLMLKISPRAA